MELIMVQKRISRCSVFVRVTEEKHSGSGWRYKRKIGKQKEKQN
jgi:hypothetical protein